MKPWKILFTFFLAFTRKLALLFRRRSKAIIIVKIDAIGDYLLFRNFLHDIKNSDRYNGFTITLIGNSLWKDLYERLDEGVADRLIWLDHTRYSNSMADRRKFLRDVTDTKYSDLIVFHYSRTFTTEVLAFAISAGHKIGMNGDRNHLSSKYTDRFYTELVNIPGDCVHEISKNAAFTSAVLGTKILRSVPSIEFYPTEALADNNTIVVAPGAGSTQRQLPVECWKRVIVHMLSKGHKVLLIGSRSEQTMASKLVADIGTNGNLVDHTGTTSLADIPSIVANSKMVVCNETSTYHFAVALKKMVVCFSGGGHFRRFASYEESPLIKLVYHRMDCFNCSWNCIYPEQAKVTYPCISAIEEAVIIKSIDEALDSTKS